MKNKKLYLVIIIGFISFISTYPVYSGTIHTATGTVRLSSGDIPTSGSLTFTAYIVGREGEVITESTDYPANGYDASSGQWWVQCGNFSTSWTTGDVLRINFVDSNSDETGYDEVTLTNASYDDGGQTTLSAPSESMTAPSTPSGTATGYKGQSNSYTTSGGSSSLGHALEYQFDWGDGNSSDWSSSSSANHSFSSTGAFSVKARVRCELHPGNVSDWSSALSVSINPITLTVNVSPSSAGTVNISPEKSDYDYNESVSLTANGSGNYVFQNWSGDLSSSNASESINMNSSKTVTANFQLEEVTTPSTPSGAGSGYVAQSLSFTSGGATNTFGHTLEYQFDWGDGSQSDWGSTSASHSYSSNGNYNVTARARCQVHPSVVSGWSSAKSVSVSYISLTTSVDPGGAGSIQRSPDKTNFSYNESVTLTATGTGNYAFDHWSGDLSGSTNPASFNITSPRSITAHFVEETVSAPTSVTGPTTGFKAQSLSFSASGASNSFGHTVEYQFDWGDGNQSGWVSSSTSHAYSASGSFGVKVRARCQVHTSIVSSWYDNHTVVISGCVLTTSVSPSGGGSVAKSPTASDYNYGATVQLTATANAGFGFINWSGNASGSSNPVTVTMNGNRSVTANFTEEVISAPGTPSGPATGFTGQTLSFTGSGASSNLGNPVEYQFDWAGTSSSWGSATQTHAFATGNFNVRVRARSQVNTDKVSAWSSALAVNVTQTNLTITVSPSGAGSVSKSPDQNGYDFSAIVQLTAAPTDGRYQFSGWSGDASGSSNPTSVSMTGNKSVTANFAMETVSTPSTPSGPTTGLPGESLSFSTSGSASSFGHSVEYRFDWGDGNISTWGSSSRSYTYTNPGTYDVKAQARCTTHTDIVSAWSGGHNVALATYTLDVSVSPAGSGTVTKNPVKSEYNHGESVELTATATDGSFQFDHWSGDLSGNTNPVSVTMTSDQTVVANFLQETVDKPSTPTTEIATGFVGQAMFFVTSGATSSFGHNVEYLFAWDDGTPSSWASYKNYYHTFDHPGTFSIRVRARCVDHPGVESELSDPLIVTISYPTLSLTIEPEGTGTIIRTPDKTNYNYDETVNLAATPIGAYQFDHWSGDASGTDSDINITMSGNKTVTAHFLAETVSTPTVSGVTSGITGQELTYTASGAVSSLAHDVEYRFDWGNSNTSAWGAVTRKITYSTGGNFNVRVQARCVDHPEIVSAWSLPVSVSITSFTITLQIQPTGTGTIELTPDKTNFDYHENVDALAVANPGYSFDYWSGDLSGNENPQSLFMDANKTITAYFKESTELVTVPNTPSGPSTGVMGISVSFTTGGSSSNLGNPVEYQFDWGDGNLSGWGNGSSSHSYSSAGAMSVRARARSKTNTSVVSAWSSTKQITIQGYQLTLVVEPEAAGTITPEPAKSVFGQGDIVNLTAEATPGYAFDHWSGDASGNTVPLVLTMDGNKSITGHFSKVDEIVSTPSKPTGDVAGIKGQTLAFQASGASSNLSHTVEYQFDWGDTATSEWGSPTGSHVYFTNGELQVRARARCTEHPEVVSAWSEPLVVTIHGLSLAIFTEPNGAANVNVTPAMGDYVIGDTVTLEAVPAMFYVFERWSSHVENDLVNPTKIVMMTDEVVTVYLKMSQETVSAPLIIAGESRGYRREMLTFAAGESQSNLGNPVEYQFDWGDGTTSEWGVATDQLMHHISRFTADAGKSGLMNAGYLVNYQKGEITDIMMSIQGGWFTGEIIGAEPDSATDAYTIFNGKVNGLGTIRSRETSSEPLVISLSGLSPEKEYRIVFYANADQDGDNQFTHVLLSGAASFVNESSQASHAGNGIQLATSSTDSITVLPANNTATGYVTRYDQIMAGADGQIQIVVSNQVSDQTAYAIFASAFMIQEIDPANDQVTLTAYNDFAWSDATASHLYTLSGDYNVRVHARSRLHPEVVSLWSESSNIQVKGCTVTTVADPIDAGEIEIDPQQSDYDFGETITLFAIAQTSYVFDAWEDMVSDTMKKCVLYGDATFTAYFSPASAIATIINARPVSYALDQNYPNPFNPQTTIRYALPDPGLVSITIYNMNGQVVRSLVSTHQNAGNYTIEWHADNDRGQLVPSGIYMYQIRVNGYRAIRKMVLMK
ncbi:InlB B-repeat-containing protein [candidate division KSB1 bacterium]|nr:InlB B-repeat-containing protein [candidate division KSB1 bacterium]